MHAPFVVHIGVASTDEAVRAGCLPGIFNTHQGGQFTSAEWTGRPVPAGSAQNG
ncbi:hypothetical protein [Prosthecobacter sp.]|uniref:hypothetical protein n=1 Tax=Prosthecobacter sp. TaxID=1965333 RepID=UPI0037840ADB